MYVYAAYLKEVLKRIIGKMVSRWRPLKTFFGGQQVSRGKIRVVRTPENEIVSTMFLCTCQLHAPLPHLLDRVGDSRGLDIVKLTNSPPLGHFLGANLLLLPLLLQRG